MPARGGPAWRCGAARRRRRPADGRPGWPVRAALDDDLDTPGRAARPRRRGHGRAPGGRRGRACSASRSDPVATGAGARWSSTLGGPRTESGPGANRPAGGAGKGARWQASSRSDFPTARPGARLRARRASSWPSPSAPAWPRRPSWPPSTAARSTWSSPLPDGAQVGHRHRRLRRRPRGAAPLDRPRPGPGGAPPVARGQVRHRPGDRERLLLRLRAAGRGPLQRRRPRAHRGRDAGRS